MYVIGTAGHVDHGKSALVEALTGIDPDRLQEEKDRGLTIDLGFAWLTLPSGEEVSIVDVPGHERFIKNMLAGVGGIDLALLIVAADEGIMPQTLEHLAILDLLGVEQGVAVLAKRDLVDEEWLSLVRDEVEELLAGTGLAGSPVVACSARTGDGLSELIEVVAEKLDGAPKAVDIGRARLPIDRVFTMAGFGTVVTGTLLDGSLKVGDEVEVLPGRLRPRIRGLQNHKRKTETALPGRRTAVNLSGVNTSDLGRGMQIVQPGAISTAALADVRLRVLDGQRIKHGARVMVHHFAAEVEARVSLLEEERLNGGEGWAELRLASPLPIVRGDRLVIRAGGQTLGGGQVVDIPATRQRRGHTPTVERLSAMASGGRGEVLRVLESIEPCTRKDFMKRAAGLSDPDRLLQAELAAGTVVECQGWLISAGRIQALLHSALQVIGAHHERYRLRWGMSAEELRRRLDLPAEAADALVARWLTDGSLESKGPLVSIAGWQPRITPAENARLRALVDELDANPYAPEATPIDAELAAYAAGAGHIVRVGELYFSRAAYDEMAARIIESARIAPITLAQVRDMFGTSRRYAQALLEHLDQQRITRRVGDARVLRGATPEAEGAAASTGGTTWNQK